MRCHTALTALSPFLDGQLAGDRLAELDRHLQDCAACMAELNALRAADAVAQQTLSEEPLSPTFVADLERRIAREGDLVPSAGALTVRAIIPMAAAVVLGATVTFMGMQVGRSRPATAPVDGALVGFPEAAPVEHAPIDAGYVEASQASDGFAARADVLLTNLGQLSGHDPARELAFVRNETAAIGLEPAMASARASVRVIGPLDPMRALRLERALKGTTEVLRRLEADGSADTRLLAARREMLQRQLRALVREIAPDGMPRPRRSRRATSGHPDENDPKSVWSAAFRHYGNGHVSRANALFVKYAALATHSDEKGRANYWIAKTSLLDGKPHITLKMLPQVQAFSPGAAADISKQMRVLLTAGGATIIIAEADGAMHLQIDGERGGELERRIEGPAVREHDTGQMQQLHQHLRERLARMKAEFERMPQAERSQVRRSFETAELPTPHTSHYFYRTAAVRVDGTEVKLTGASKTLRDTAPVIAYRILRARPRRVSRDQSGAQVYTFDVWDRESDTKRKISRRVQFGSWEAQQFIEELQQAIGTTLIDEQKFSTFKTIEFVVGPPGRSTRAEKRRPRAAEPAPMQPTQHPPKDGLLRRGPFKGLRFLRKP